MLKAILIAGLLMIAGQISFQNYPLYKPFLFTNAFLQYPNKAIDIKIIHYVDIPYLKADYNTNKRSEKYAYLHKGDNLKGTQDLLTSNIQGSDWLKNFNFRKFSNVSIKPGNGVQHHSS